MSGRLRQRYRDDVVPALSKEFSYGNPMQVPRLDKIVVNIGLGEALTNAKALDAGAGEFALGVAAIVVGLLGVLTIGGRREPAAFRITRRNFRRRAVERGAVARPTPALRWCRPIGQHQAIGAERVVEDADEVARDRAKAQAIAVERSGGEAVAAFEGGGPQRLVVTRHDGAELGVEVRAIR